MHALVTGGGGFLGGYIVEALIARGDHVRSFGRGNYPGLRAQGVEVIRGDIRDRDAVAAACHGIDCVFHTAAMPGIGMRAKQYDEINRIGTDNVLFACKAAHVSRLVYTSSPSVTFAGDDQCGIDESASYGFDWLTAHRAYYSLSKAHAERNVLTANQLSFRTCALRPHLLWGPGDTQLIPRLIARARAGRLRRIGEGANLVDITYVENAADAHLQAADALAQDTHGEAAAAAGCHVAGRSFFLSQGQRVNCWQWINEILALLNLPPVTKSLSYTSAWRLGAFCEVGYHLTGVSAEPPMTRFLAAQLAKSHWFDISAAKRDLGYQPCVSTEEGMCRLGEWLRKTAKP